MNITIKDYETFTVLTKGHNCDTKHWLKPTKGINEVNFEHIWPKMKKRYALQTVGP